MGKPYYPDYVESATEPTKTTEAEATVSKAGKATSQSLWQAYQLADELLTKRYIAHLSKYPVVSLDKELSNEPLNKTLRLFHVERIVYNASENNQEKLMNVYHALYTCQGSAVMLIQSDGSKIDFYIGTRADNLDVLVPSKNVLQKVITGNFSGTQLSEPLLKRDVKKLMNDIFIRDGSYPSIASITGIPAFHNRTDESNETFVQGIERLTDAMHGEKYTLMILADPVSQDELSLLRHSYENLYTQLVPLAQTEVTLSQNETQAVNDVLMKGISHGISSSLAQLSSIAEGKSKSHTDSKSHTESSSQTNSQNAGGNLGLAGAAIGSMIPGVGTGIGLALGGIANINKGKATTIGTADTKGQADTFSTSVTQSTGTTTTTGTTDSTNQSESHGFSASQSLGQSQQIHFVNKTVQKLMEQIDKQLERLDDCNDMGLWKCAAYVIANNPQTCQIAASIYQSLLRGEDSGTETGAVNLWQSEENQKKIKAYLSNFRHPIFELDANLSQFVTPATYISSKELTIAAGFPQKSIPGLPTATFAPLAREVIWQNKKPQKTVCLGNIYHLGQVDTTNHVELDANGLTAHTFITGSTGSGKSNAVYELLHHINVPWLVIEPAKGEYKDIFGGYANVTVYGTNPYKYPNMLYLNPFAFPDDVHVLEHVDRLVEIFNACWPMYAAMPSILREAIECAYEACGWSLELSHNPGQFPTFTTLLEVLPQVIDRSAYSADTTNDYKGALVTRVRSLTRGIHGVIFQKDISLKNLLQENSIIDLSRIGSQETKSLLMGILMLKLQEYRMSENIEHNSELRHVTVLEEAHNLLKRTSDVQVQESANLQGEAVAMIANAIAEMRTYGEGFMIVDQSPGAMDPSVIRNTNTKIILRLPDQSDRELVGKAAGLTSEQVDELTDLERGVAAVYQSGWESPVFCKIGKFSNAKAMRVKYQQKEFPWMNETLKIKQRFIIQLMRKKEIIFTENEMESLKRWGEEVHFTKKVFAIFMQILAGRKVDDKIRLLLLRYILRLGKLTRKEEIIEQAKRQLIFIYGFDEENAAVADICQFLQMMLPDNLATLGESNYD